MSDSHHNILRSVRPRETDPTDLLFVITNVSIVLSVIMFTCSIRGCIMLL